MQTIGIWQRCTTPYVAIYISLNTPAEVIVYNNIFEHAFPHLTLATLSYTLTTTSIFSIRLGQLKPQFQRQAFALLEGQMLNATDSVRFVQDILAELQK